MGHNIGHLLIGGPGIAPWAQPGLNMRTQLYSENGEHCHLGVGFNFLAKVGENSQ